MPAGGGSSPPLPGVSGIKPAGTMTGAGFAQIGLFAQKGQRLPKKFPLDGYSPFCLEYYSVAFFSVLLSQGMGRTNGKFEVMPPIELRSKDISRQNRTVKNVLKISKYSTYP